MSYFWRWRGCPAIGGWCAKVGTRCRRGIVTTICITPSLGDHRASSPWWSMWSSVLSCPTWEVIAQQYPSFQSWRINSSIVEVAGISAMLCSVPEDMFFTSSGTTASLIASTSRMTVPVPSGVFIAKSGSSSSSVVVSASSAGNLGSASAGYFFILTRRITS